MNTQLLEKKLETELTNWKSYGAVSTPAEIVELMLDLAGINKWKGLSILEPACGFCHFLTEIYQRHPNNTFYGIDSNSEVYGMIRKTYSDLPFELNYGDYLLRDSKRQYDLIIGNPPYGIIGDRSHYAIHVVKHKKEKYKAEFLTWQGKYNIYGAFIEKSVNLLKPGGKLVFITPATWMILDDFKKLRNFLALSGHTQVYYLGNKVFKGVSVSVAVMVFEKGGQGLSVYYKENGVIEKSHEFKEWKGEMVRFETRHTHNFSKAKITIADIFNINISARSPEVNKFPYLLKEPKKDAMPFMNGRNTKKGVIDRHNYYGLWVQKQHVDKLKKFYGILPRIVVGHTKGGKIVAALEEEPYPYLGDVYHLTSKQRLSRAQLVKIVKWLNSEDMARYVETLYKNISPHITATQLKKVPLDINIKSKTLF